VNPTKASKSQQQSGTPATLTESREARELNHLHKSTKSNTPQVPKLAPGTTGTPSGLAHRPKNDGPPRMSFTQVARAAEDELTSDYGTNLWDSGDLPEVDELIGVNTVPRTSPPKEPEKEYNFEFNENDFSYMDAAEHNDTRPSDTEDDDMMSFSASYRPTTTRNMSSINDDLDVDALPHQTATSMHPGQVEAAPLMKNRMFVESSTHPASTDPRAAPIMAISHEHASAEGDVGKGESMQGVRHDVPKQDEDDFDWFRRTFGEEMFNLVD
jgi:hypothetical protein